LQRPLITLHTRRDQQVPYVHELLYQYKTLASGALFTRHLNLPVDRYEHCNFNANEVLFSFGIMLAYDGALDQSRLSPSLKSDVKAELARRMRTAGLSLSAWDAAGTLHIQK
ncbi:MAG: hypothetical protein ABI818_11100, partial [Acidobacteriota bacterium]